MMHQLMKHRVTSQTKHIINLAISWNSSNKNVSDWRAEESGAAPLIFSSVWLWQYQSGS
jgi:hypothetical protein